MQTRTFWWFVQMQDMQYEMHCSVLYCKRMIMITLSSS